MYRIAALNDETSDDESAGIEEVVRTKEAEESEALNFYKRGLELLQKRDIENAIENFYLTLESNYFKNVQESESTSSSNQSSAEPESEKALAPHLQLKYACWKNIAAIYKQQKKWEESLDSYLEAVAVDEKDVTVWYSIGNIAIQLNNLQFARHAFKQGLKYSPSHWPCIDQLITVTFALCDDVECLYYISMGLAKDPYFLRGLVIRDAIFNEIPALKEDIKYFNGEFWESLFESQPYSAEDAKDFLDEVVELRSRNGSAGTVKETPVVYLAKSPGNSWKSLGESLLETYKYVEKRQSKTKLSYRVEVRGSSLAEENMEIPEDDSPATPGVVEEQMEVDPEVAEVSETGNGSSQPEEPAAKLDDDKTNPAKRKSSTGEMTTELQRRSTRSRACTQRTEEDVTSLRAELRSFLPTSLLLDSEEEPGGGVVPESLSPKKQPRLQDFVDLRAISELDESKAVEDFLNEADSWNCGVVDLLIRFCDATIQLDDRHWTEGLAGIFKEAYQLSRRHWTLPNVFSDSQSEDLEIAGRKCLFHAEVITCSLKEATDAPHWFLEDLFFLFHLTEKRGLYGNKMAAFQCRVHWMRAQWYSSAGDIEAALAALSDVNDSMFVLKHIEDKDFFVTRNGDSVSKVTIKDVKSLYDDLSRTSQLENIEHLHKTGQYEDVVELLKTTFHLNAANQSCVSLERPIQLKMLLEGLRHLNQEKEFFQWTEICLWEAVKNLQENSHWLKFISTVLENLEQLTASQYFLALSLLDKRSRARFAESLVLLCSFQMEAPDSRTDIPLGTILPWILLHQLIEYEEILAAESKLNLDLQEEEDEEALNLSVLYLFSAHEMLGKRSWCMQNDGRFVLHCLHVFRNKIRDNVHYEEIFRTVEQLTYCAFGFPARKSKNRLLQEHSVPSLALTWTRALLLAEFYLPEAEKVPEFDSLKPISDELELLLKRITTLVPCEINPANHEEVVLDFINGKTNSLSNKFKNNFPEALKDIFYLLADFNFKSKDWNKAIQNYIYDLTVNPDRFDSWAALALAKGSRLETRLNSCERYKNIGNFLDKAEAALRCFRRAIYLRPAHSTLWIEHGNTAYMLHSCYSRLLHLETDTLSIDLFERLEISRERTLHIAKDCFQAADKAWEMANANEEAGGEQDERWLHHYMLGKISEKTNGKLNEYLDHYQNAAKLLEEAGATYPRRIGYNNPPSLSVEALEVYYRIHASILKVLLQQEDKQLDMETVEVMRTHLAKAAEGLFAKGGRRSSTEEEKPGMKRKSSKSDEEPTSKKSHVEETPREGRAGAIFDVTLILNEVIDRVIAEGKEPIRAKSPGKELIREELPEKVEEKEPTEEKLVEEEPMETKIQEKGPIGVERRVSTHSVMTISSNTSSPSGSGSSDSPEIMEIEQQAPPPLPDLRPIIEACISAIKECVNRFPNFYKGLYRLAHYYYQSKKDHNIEACRELLWGRPPNAALAQLQMQQGMAVPRFLPIGIGGLFCEWRAHNFFNGIWRIPVNEIDRPGCFAAHMGRSISLLLDVLKESRDHRLVLELTLALHPEPETDKKYLFDSEREQHASLSLLLLQQMLRTRLHELFREKEKLTTTSDASLVANSSTRRLSLLMDVFRTYDRLQRDIPGKESGFTTILVDAYKLYKDAATAKDSDTSVLEQALSFCRIKQAQSRVRMGSGRGAAFSAGRGRRGVGGGRRGRPPGTGRPREAFKVPGSVPRPAVPSAPPVSSTAIIDEALRVLRSTGGSAENLPAHLKNIPGISNLLAMFAKTNRSSSEPKKDTAAPASSSGSGSKPEPSPSTSRTEPSPSTVQKPKPAEKPKETPKETVKETVKATVNPTTSSVPGSSNPALMDPALLSLMATNPYLTPIGLLGSGSSILNTAMAKNADYQQQMLQWMQAAQTMMMPRLGPTFSSVPRRAGTPQTPTLSRKPSGRRPGRPPMFPGPNLGFPQQLGPNRPKTGVSTPTSTLSTIPTTLLTRTPQSQPSTSKDPGPLPQVPKTPTFPSLPKGMPLSTKGKDFRPIKLPAPQSVQSKPSAPKTAPPLPVKAPISKQSGPTATPTSTNRDLTITSVSKSPAAPFPGGLPKNLSVKPTSSPSTSKPGPSKAPNKPVVPPSQAAIASSSKLNTSISSALAGLSPAVSIFSQTGKNPPLDLRALTAQANQNLSYSVLKNLSPSMSLLVKPPDAKKQQQQSSSKAAKSSSSSGLDISLTKQSSTAGNLSRSQSIPGINFSTGTSAAAMLYSQFSNAVSVTQKNPNTTRKDNKTTPKAKGNNDDDIITLE